MRYTLQSLPITSTRITAIPQGARVATMSAQPHVNLAYLRIFTALLLLAAIVWTLMHVQPTYAAETCSARNCVLACSSAKKICSLFPNKAVPAGYARVSYLPFGYRRVRQSNCDKMVCPTFSTTCRRWIPTGKNTNATP